MGMFDYLHSSLHLFDDESDKDLQTKDFECSMSNYWLNPHGQLYQVNYLNTYRLIENAKSTDWRDFFKWQPTGNKGVVTPYMKTTLARVYPSKWNEKDGDWPELHLYFRFGQLKEIVSIPNRY